MKFQRILAAGCLIVFFAPISFTFGATPDSANGAVVQVQSATRKGTAFYISENGYLLTNFHVIDGAGTVDICVQENTASKTVCDAEAEVIADDPATDVALLKLKTSRKINRPFLTLGDSDTLSVSDPIRLFGYPDTGGDALTISNGQVIGWFEGKKFVKVDAALSHGSSGGAMLDENGVAVGVTMAILKEQHADSGLIIPINRVKEWLDSIGYGSAALFGDSVEALTQSKQALEDRLRKYRELTKAQMTDFNRITDEHEALRKTEEQNLQTAFDKLEANKRTEQAKIDEYLASIQPILNEKSYAVEKERVDGLWEEFLTRVAEEEARVTAAYEHNLTVIAKMEAIALEKAGVTDYTARIRELHANLEEVKRKLSRLKLQEATKKRIATPSSSPTAKLDPPQHRDNESGSNISRYENFGSMLPVLLDNWSLRSVHFQKNNTDFAFVFWSFQNPLPAGSLARVTAEITDAETGEKITPLVVRKKFLLFRFQPNGKYRLSLSAEGKNGEILEKIIFTAGE